jgi:hypothetical protein
MGKLLLVYFVSVYLPLFGQGIQLECDWTTCGIDFCNDRRYPVRVESGLCVQPDGITCNGTSILCCNQSVNYRPYWVGTPPNCFATCSDCNPGDFCFNQRRKCNDCGESCAYTSTQMLCGSPSCGLDTCDAIVPITSGHASIIGGYIGSFLGGMVTTILVTLFTVSVSYVCHKKRKNHIRNKNYAGEVVAKG